MHASNTVQTNTHVAPVRIQHHDARNLAAADAPAELVHHQDAGGHKQAGSGGVKRLPLAGGHVGGHFGGHLKCGSGCGSGGVR